MLTQEYLESQGWDMYAKSVDLWFKFRNSPISHTDIQENLRYKPYSLFMNYGKHDGRMKITCDFTGGLDFGESDTLFEGMVKTPEDYKYLCKLLGIHETNTTQEKSETT